ncbi:hypothetical protein P7C70_g1236, partial [Phenoliferia sp. Uapishka_3]
MGMSSTVKNLTSGLGRSGCNNVVGSDNDDSSGLSTGGKAGAIAGGIIGGLFVLALAALGFWLYKRHERRHGARQAGAEKGHSAMSTPHPPYPLSPTSPISTNYGSDQYTGLPELSPTHDTSPMVHDMPSPVYSTHNADVPLENPSTFSERR